ncbi:MAG TPA: glutamate synthase large subunit [Candidatus Aphodomonas merdavium]|nr:glutamate synthase large subunit [Candidatus Aphodomonas merdavium]
MKDDYPLYDPQMEHESCGVGAVVDLGHAASHRTVSDALKIVERLAHRAGSDALGTTGDGVGILTQLPHVLFAAWAQAQGVCLGGAGNYGVGMFFLPGDAIGAQDACAIFARLAAVEGIEILAWRDVPCHPELLGEAARRTMPCIRQCFLARPSGVQPGIAFDRRLYLLRRAFERQSTGAYLCSLSSRTIVYKGMMLVEQLRGFYEDLQEESYASRLALVHSRFSTNTMPSWAKAHPQRMLLHNGEINTIRGNADRMLAREETMSSPVLGEAMRRAFPVVLPDGSDSQMLDNTLEFLNMNGMPLPLAGMVLLPAPWQGWEETVPYRDLYRYYATMMEPWDGPAAVLYCDGDMVCASLDRNGLRPLRCAWTEENRLILSSEAGVLEEEAVRTRRRWRLEPGGVLMADINENKLYDSAALRERYARLHPYAEWTKGILRLDDLSDAGEAVPEMTQEQCQRLCRAFGYSLEDIDDVLMPMAQNGEEPVASMGADEPLAVLSKAHPPLFSYFQQRFAQVTNPPIDALREHIKTDCTIYLGDDGNLLSPCAQNCAVLELHAPVLTAQELARIQNANASALHVCTVSLLYPKTDALQSALEALFGACDAAVRSGANVVVLSDRNMDQAHLAIPSLLAASALEQHLIREKKRTAVSVLLESGEPRDVHQLAMLIGFGVRAVNPYLAHECIAGLCRSGKIKKDAAQAIADYNAALTRGVLKVASKMGVSTLQAYQSAQLFEAVGLDAALVDEYFTNTPHFLGGTDLARIEADARWHHAQAFESGGGEAPERMGVHRYCAGNGKEEHLFRPEVVEALSHAVRENDRQLFERYAALVEREGPRTIRSLLDFRFDACSPVPLCEVEPAESIVKRFRTGAMSFGSISREAHECLALAMNRLGGKSNSGEGGELAERFATPLNSAIKQVASGRFGVTREYLLSAEEIQIKMAQGAKPGEGGHLPASKVSPEVARTRCATAGISLISPPPHHDVYSIEDLAELIYDLKCANESAQITVKLASCGGVGTIASGVAKAGAQGILISGGEGGTGAAALSSIHHAGLPWEIGLAQAHQVLCRNGLRRCVALEADGKLMTGHDVAVALLLGAETFSFGTAPLIALGCKMCRSCHLGACPCGIATQDPRLRSRFAAKPEYVERFMLFVAEELRQIMARLGARTVDELVGRADLLKMKENAPIDLSDVIAFSRNTHFSPQYAHDFHLRERTDANLRGETCAVHTTDRAFGTMLQERRHVCAHGFGGQSFGAFLRQGQQLTLCGEANDYLGKGLSGGVLAVRPPREGAWRNGDALIGNVALYGATSGYAFIAGMAGERFCVRNSGAVAVAEGVGEHGCEYMTGGRAVILGPVGDNFAAGMSGGIAYVLDETDELARRVNPASVEIHELTGEQARELYGILQKHADATGSPKAEGILARFDSMLPAFRAVIPSEYRRALERNGET